MEFSYSRRLNRPVLYFKYFTMFDLFGLVIGVVVVPPIFGMSLFFGGAVIWFVYTLAFRIGRAPGYGHHYFKSLFQSSHFTVGRLKLRRAVRRSP
ncbi:MAG TPA: hypothetical protein VKC60_14480 [Opitutaceae bacterium]|nr:hypothetical protein [Opitutaceae bacterium]